MNATPISLTGRDLLQDSDLTPAEFRHLLAVAAQLKAEKRARREVRRLEGRSIALIFEKTSTRTRCAFEIAAFDQGGHATVLDPASSQIGHKESTADTARVLSRFYDGIQFRGSAQVTVAELAEYADVPVWNGLTDDWHPTQALADALTMHESAGADTAIPFTYMGDARNNVAHSLLVMGAMLGHDVRIAAPASLWPSPEVRALADGLARDSGATLTITEDPAEALSGARFVHTDVWVSMGEPKEVWQERIELLRPYRVDAAAMAATGREDAAFMHCLPAFHDANTAVGRSAAQLSGLEDGIEVAHEVFESARSLVFEQAENRLHTIKALLVETLS